MLTQTTDKNNQKTIHNITHNTHRTHQVLDDYILIEQLGSGSFGEVYLAENKKGDYIAVKVEDNKKAKRILNEYRIYEYLHNCKFEIGLPKVYDFLQTPNFNIMVMQLLGPSLEDLFNEYNRKFTISTIFMLALQLIFLLNKLHDTGYIHRDIKPNNFLIGRGSDSRQLYIMDFGLSKKYIDNSKHIEFKNNRSLVGTPRYASVNLHMGFEPSRRDELESVGYMLIYLAKGILPWQGIKNTDKAGHIKSIGEVKMCTSLKKLCEELPECFEKYLSYCKKLKFDETPDYVYLIDLFKSDAFKLGFIPKYQWID